MKGSLKERWAAKTTPDESGCVLWQGAKDRNGYGQLRDGPRLLKAHRLAWTFEHGSIPSGMLVLHRCDNPPCVKLDHLFLGTASDNMRDATAKGHNPQARKTTCKKGHPFDDANTRYYRGWRICRACKLEANRRVQLDRLAARGIVPGPTIAIGPGDTDQAEADEVRPDDS